MEANVEGKAVYGYSFTVGAINTTIDVQLEGSIDETNYAVLPLDCSQVPGIASITENVMQIDTDGTYLIYSSAPVVDVRFKFNAEAGGETATIDCDFFARRA